MLHIYIVMSNFYYHAFHYHRYILPSFLEYLKDGLDSMRKCAAKSLFTCLFTQKILKPHFQKILGKIATETTMTFTLSLANSKISHCIKDYVLKVVSLIVYPCYLLSSEFLYCRFVYFRVCIYLL